ncbi:FG-GAP repeat protein [Telmatocola sphagniphila]|uniref:FG-GAP repeat protein n=1 Tax=Telmatocola sphagniphila TaxID=1123043 RepID=A0A8E6B3R6_9BACT|nr:VCBS repeat-containing protein [Telmatocola sphagniphila]QVL30576.1 FG-GAP repeat protein [Telmatocola sphagniphila]
MALSRWMKTLFVASKTPSAVASDRRRTHKLRRMMEPMEDRCPPASWTWTGITTGSQNWSDATQWSPNTVPANTTSTALTFLNYTQSGYNAVNDIAASFAVNTLTFNGRYGYMQSTSGEAITGAQISGDSVGLNVSSGVNPTITQSGGGVAAYAASDIDINAPLTITGDGNGSLLIEGTTSLSGNSPSITINRGGNGFTLLDDPTGNPTINLNAGNLVFGSNSNANLVVNGGTLSYGLTTTPTDTTSNLSLNSTLNVSGSTSNIQDGVVTGQGGLSIYPLLPITYTLRNSDNYAGATTAGSSYLSKTGATIILGTNGTVVGQITGSSGLIAARGGTIEVNNLNLPSTNTSPNRIGDSIPLTLYSGGTFEYTGYNNTASNGATSSAFQSTETIGTLNASGNPTIILNHLDKETTDVNTNAITFADYNVAAGTNILFQANNLGNLGASNNNYDTINFTNTANISSGLIGGNGALGTSYISILPSAYGNEYTTNNTTGNTLVTYTTANGIRPLQFTEYASTFSGTTQNNIREIVPTTVGGSTLGSINALVLDASSSTNYGQLTGAGRLNIASGVILASGANPNSDPTSSARNRIDISQLDFATRPGYFIVPTALTVTSPITGFNGYTVSGGGTLTLSGNNNALSGTIYLAGGNLSLASLATSLGGSGAVVLNGGTLQYTGTGETFSRGFNVSTGDGFINVGSSSADLNVTGAISGSGNLYNTGSGILEINGNSAISNAFTGNYVNNAGATLQFDNEGSIGSANSLILQNGSTLNLPNSMSIDTPINLLANGTLNGTPNPFGSATINTGGNIVVNKSIGYIGDIYSQYGINKTGSGTLTLNNEQKFPGVLDVQQGTVYVNGQLDAINAAGNGVVVENGASLGGTGNIIRDVTVNAGGNLTPGVSTGVLNTGSVTFANSTSTYSVDIAGTTVGTNYSQLDVTGGINLNGATLSPTFGYTPAPGDTFTIIKNLSNNPIVGTFNNLPEGSTFKTAQGTFRISYQGGSGHDVTLTTLDTVAPKLLSINRNNPTNSITNASSVTYTVVFSKPVVGVSAGNFSITGTASSSATFGTIVSYDGGTTWTVPIVGLGSVNGTIQLNLFSASGIADHSGNALSSGFVAGPVYTIDHVQPSVTITAASGQANPTSSTPIKFDVNFSKNVTGFSASGITVTGTAGAGNVTITGSGSSYVVSINHVTRNGVVTIAVPAGAVTDSAGNSNISSAPSSITYDQTALFALGAGPGNGPDVRVYSASSGQLLYNFFAYNSNFRGGVSVATADFNGDSVKDIVTGAGPGADPHVDVFNGVNGQELPGYSFDAFSPAYLGGITVAAGDINGDGIPDIVVGTMAGTAPHIEVFDGATLKLINSFYAYSTSYLGGVNVAVADINGDGYGDVIVSTASGNSPHVEVFAGGPNGLNLNPIESFIASGVIGANGISVSAGITQAGNTKATLVIGDLTNGQVAVYSGTSLVTSFAGFEPGVTNVGARVLALDTTGTGIASEIAVASGPTAVPRIRLYSSTNYQILNAFNVYDPQFLGGVNVG